MADSVYRVTEVIGASSESWEAAARKAVETAASTVRDLRVAEVTRKDVTIENGKVTSYRVRLEHLLQVRSPRSRRRGAGPPWTGPRGVVIGETGFEPATARPPAGCATRLRHSPWLSASSGRRESNPP